MRIFLNGALRTLLLIVNVKAAILPPPWADPSKNPCASQPRGWQLLYWPADGKCYKIFQIGAPCPETMELGPAAEGGGTIAECKCPPGTAQSPRDALCHAIFTKASCDHGQYFAPVPDTPKSNRSKRRWGVCQKLEVCPEKDDIYWPRDGKCYSKLTKGPCLRGELLTTDEDGMGKCSCSAEGELGRYYWSGIESGCYEYYTLGPCTEPGELFLPGGYCGCDSSLPNYHPETKMCYPLGEDGPCLPGHKFVMAMENVTSAYEIADAGPIHAKCVCKTGHVLYNENGICYRLYTRGPCERGEMLINSTNCVRVPCKRGRLYFPNEKTCYKIGSRGPCSNGQLVLYDHNVRPSLEGVGYNGICGCTNESRKSDKCMDEERNESCENKPGMVLINRACYKLYTRGPCATGEWLVAQRNAKDYDFSNENFKIVKFNARCECRPGYKRIHADSLSVTSDLDNNVLNVSETCQPPAVDLARFLNDKTLSIEF